MEFNQKLQELRKQKGLTQEELAERLYVTRTAVSKWESGRGYPNLDSLKAISRLFNVSIDTLLSGSELLTLAAEDTRRREKHSRSLMFGLLDLSVSAVLFLPLFGQTVSGTVQQVSLFALRALPFYLKGAFFAYTAVAVLWGLCGLFLPKLPFQSRISMLITAGGIFLFVISRQPYAATLLLIFFAVKLLAARPVTPP